MFRVGRILPFKENVRFDSTRFQITKTRPTLTKKHLMPIFDRIDRKNMNIN